VECTAIGDRNGHILDFLAVALNGTGREEKKCVVTYRGRKLLLDAIAAFQLIRRMII
jgi:hypothetical protein